MDAKRVDELMDLAIVEARRSKPEDSRDHPYVGAVLASENGEVLATAYRGMDGRGRHAEYNLFRQIEGNRYNLRRCTLFVTLEPCIRRGEEKIPCAVRVAMSGVGRVYIGTLDPNPQITGRGEMFLLTHTEVERFPYQKQKELLDLNSGFFAKHAHEHIPAVSSLLIDPDNMGTLSLLAGQREGILQQSMDLIVGSSGPVWILAGRLSWLRELQFALVLAASQCREITILCSVPADDPQEFDRLKHIAAASGAIVKRAQNLFETRATLVDPFSDKVSMLSIEESPALHAMFIKSPHERGILAAMARFFRDEIERAAETINPTGPRWRTLADDEVIGTLCKSIPAYNQATISRMKVAADKLTPLSISLERMKLARLRVLTLLLEQGVISPTGILIGSPWPVFPPVVEAQTDGSLVIIDGAHRVYSAIERGQDMIEVLVVRGVTMPLPATPLKNWDKVTIGTAKLPREIRYRDLKVEYFRPIRDALTSLGG